MDLFQRVTGRHELIGWAEACERGACGPLPLYDPIGYFEEVLASSNADWQVPTEPVVEDPYKLLVTVKGSRYDDLGRYAAIASGARWVQTERLEDLPELLSSHDPQSLLLLLEPAQVSHDFYGFYQRELLARWPAGLLVARSEPHLSWQLLKGWLQSGTNGHLSLLPRSRKKEAGQASWKVLTRADDLHDEMQRWQEGRVLETIAFSAHGTEDVFMLANSFVCGKSALGQPAGMTCDFTTTCNFGERGFRASDLQARLVIANTCMGVRLNETILPLDASQALTFLENHAAAYVSSYMVKYGPDAEPCLLQNLITHGWSIGVAAQIVNRWIEQAGFDFPAFVVLGDPTLRVMGQAVASTDFRWLSDDAVEVSALGRTLAVIELPSDVFRRYPYVSVKSSKEIYFARVQGGKTELDRLFLYAWTPFTAETLTIEFKTGEELQLANGRLSLSSWLYGLQRHATGKKFHAQTPVIVAQLDRLAGKMQGLDYHAGSYREVLRELDKLRTLIDSIQLQTLGPLLDRAASVNTIWMPDIYLEAARMVRRQESAVNCYVCGSSVHEVRFEHPVNGDAREILFCPRCGGISDAPDLAVLEVQVLGPEKIGYEERLEQHLVITNRSACTVTGYGGLRIESTSYYGLPTFPERVHFELKPLETQAYTFSWQLNRDMVPQLYYVKGIVMHELDLYYANKPLFIMAVGVPSDPQAS